MHRIARVQCDSNLARSKRSQAAKSRRAQENPRISRCIDARDRTIGTPVISITVTPTVFLVGTALVL